MIYEENNNYMEYVFYNYEFLVNIIVVKGEGISFTIQFIDDLKC